MWSFRSKGKTEEKTVERDNRTDKRKLGDIGENSVCAYLESKGFTIVEKNYLRKWGELDIVARIAGKWHFIEVKSLSREILDQKDHIVSIETKKSISHESNDQYRAEDNLHPEKLKRLKRAIQTYISDRKISDKADWQFDVATVLVDKERKICKVSILWDIIL